MSTPTPHLLDRISRWPSRRKVAAVTIALVIVFAAGLLTPTPPGFRGPLVDLNDTLLIAVLVALGGFVAQLYLRMGKLETDVKALQEGKAEALDKLTAAASFINRVGLWIAAGCRDAMPEPPNQILPHIDGKLWESPASPAEPEVWAE